MGYLQPFSLNSTVRATYQRTDGGTDRTLYGPTDGPHLEMCGRIKKFDLFFEPSTIRNNLCPFSELAAVADSHLWVLDYLLPQQLARVEVAHT